MDKKLFAPNLTFFNYNGSVNYNMISEHISWLLENNINGLFMTGTYGLGPSLSVDESLRIYEIANKHENLINIAQINKASILETLDLIKGSNEIGVHNFASVVPYYYNYSNFEIIDYFKEDIQIFITTTDIKDINDELKAKSDIYVVDNGNFNKED